MNLLRDTVCCLEVDGLWHFGSSLHLNFGSVLHHGGSCGHRWCSGWTASRFFCPLAGSMAGASLHCLLAWIIHSQTASAPGGLQTLFLSSGRKHGRSEFALFVRIIHSQAVSAPGGLQTLFLSSGRKGHQRRRRVALLWHLCDGVGVFLSCSWRCPQRSASRGQFAELYGGRSGGSMPNGQWQAVHRGGGDPGGDGFSSQQPFGSPSPFPLLKRWTRAGHHPPFEI